METVPENGRFSCVPFCMRSLGRFTKCEVPSRLKELFLPNSGYFELDFRKSTRFVTEWLEEFFCFTVISASSLTVAEEEEDEEDSCESESESEDEPAENVVDIVEMPEEEDNDQAGDESNIKDLSRSAVDIVVQEVESEDEDEIEANGLDAAVNGLESDIVTNGEAEDRYG